MNNYQLGGTGSELDTTLQYILEKIENMIACNNSAASVPVDLSEYLKLSIISGMFAPCDLEGNEIIALCLLVQKTNFEEINCYN